jgi:L-ascorbate metabolism protein UlaG (beta-lactamase superfamily)
MQPGGTKDFGYAKITMTSAEHSSTCQGPQGIPVAGGIGVGFVVTIPHHNFAVYYAGPTNIFGDMKLIDGLYSPNVAILPLGEAQKGMGVREAAYAVKNLLPTPKTIIPMVFSTMGYETATFANFKEECEKAGVEGKELVNPSDFLKSKAVLE